MLSGNPNTARNRYPFTPNQWQELEHQALIFKYMASGIPIPTDLVYSLKRRLDNSISSRLFPHPPMGWGCYEMGFGRKVDPEPGRCRRTDGKKWRCSKEAYPESKYCERHMHRGRNRSRKPVEVSSSTTTPPTTAATEHPSSSSSSALSSPNNKNLSKTSSYSLSPLSSSISTETQTQHHPHQSNSPLYPFLNYPQSSSTSSRPPPGSVFSPQNNSSSATPHLFLNSGSYNNQAEKDYRYLHGTKGSVDELAFFPESSANGRSILTGGSSSCQPLMSSYRGYSQPQFQSLTDHHNPEVSQQSQEEEQHCFVWGTDLKSSRAIKTEKEADETQKSLHHFFGDWQPPKSTDTWLDLSSNSGVPNDG
ncbi:hypothetical protein CerSpe_104550 [Prunus speciosa]